MAEQNVAIVTGASSGIGTETARGLAKAGYRVAVVGRNPQRTEEVASGLRRQWGGEHEAFLADFASLDAVRGLASELTERFDGIHRLVNNAGLWLKERQLSADGYEMTFAVNHLASFLLTHLLAPRMLETPGEGRIVHVSSRMHHTAGRARGFGWQAVHFGEILKVLPRRDNTHLDLSDWMMEQRYQGLDSYALSKYCQILFSNEIARRLGPGRLTSNSVHPGDVATDVVRDSALLKFGMRFVKGFLMTPEEGAATSVFVSLAPELEGLSGRYYADSAEALPAPSVHRRDWALKLWDLSMSLVGLANEDLAEPLRR